MSNPVPPRRLLGVLFLGTLLAALDIALVGPALPTLREAFGLDELAVSWTFTAFVLANLIGLPIMASLADRLGRKRVYLADIALFATGTLVVAMSPTYEVLLAGRVVQGLGASGIFPVAGAVVGDAFPPEKRGRALGLLGAVFGVAFLIGPILGGITLAVASWRWLFALTLPLSALVFVLSARALPESRAANPRPFDAAGVGVLAALLGALVVGLSLLDASRLIDSLQRPLVWGALVLALALVPVLVAVERRAQAPLLRPSLMRKRSVRVACTLAVGAGAVEAGFVLLSAYAVTAFGVAESTASYLLLPLVLGITVGAPVAGRLLDRVGARPVVTAAAALVAGGLAAVSLAPSLALHIVGTVVLGVGLSGILGSSLSYLLLSEAQPHERTVAQGLSTIFLGVGQLLGAVLLGSLAASAASAEAGFRAGFGVFAIGALLLVIVARLLPTRSSGQTQLHATSP